MILYTRSKMKSELYVDKIDEYFDETGFAGDVVIVNGGLESS